MWIPDSSLIRTILYFSHDDLFTLQFMEKEQIQILNYSNGKSSGIWHLRLHNLMLFFLKKQTVSPV